MFSTLRESHVLLANRRARRHCGALHRGQRAPGGAALLWVSCGPTERLVHMYMAQSIVLMVHSFALRASVILFSLSSGGRCQVAGGRGVGVRWQSVLRVSHVVFLVGGSPAAAPRRRLPAAAPRRRMERSQFGLNVKSPLSRVPTVPQSLALTSPSAGYHPRIRRRIAQRARELIDPRGHASSRRVGTQLRRRLGIR